MPIDPETMAREITDLLRPVYDAISAEQADIRRVLGSVLSRIDSLERDLRSTPGSPRF